MKTILVAISALFIMISSCTTNAITGRSQLTLIPESSLQAEAFTQYKSFLSQNKVVPESGSRDAVMVNRVGNRIARAIQLYYSSKGKSAELNGYNWEFNLVNDKQVNAWCMPGGKVVVYSGLLPVTQNEAALAIVMGHEITHAVAHHGQERMSQAVLAQGIEAGGGVFTSGNQKANSIFTSVFAPTAQLGVLLPNSRKQEYEADHYGLIFAAMAGYDPREAIPFWTRMAALNKNSAPEFLSDHPIDSKRIAALQGYMNEALGYYKPAGK